MLFFLVQMFILERTYSEGSETMSFADDLTNARMTLSLNPQMYLDILVKTILILSRITAVHIRQKDT